MPLPRTGWPRALWRALSSGRLAVYLLTAYVVWYLLSLAFPQVGLESDAELAAWVELNGAVGRAAEWVGLLDLKRSWLLFTTHQLLFINLVTCMLKRVRPMLAASRRPAFVPPAAALRLQRTLQAPELTAATAERLLQRRGYATVTEGDAVYGLRGRFAYVGHFVFHVGFVVLLVVGARIGFAPEPFRATVGVGEGEPFSLHGSQLLGSNRPVDDTLPPLTFELEEATVETVDLDVTRFDARLRTPEGSRIAGINRPYRHGPYQVATEGFGYMPGWVLVRSGEMVGGAWVKLVPFPNEYRDVIPLGEDGAVEFVLLPHRVHNDEGSINASNALENPYFLVTVRWRDGVAYEGWLAPGEPVELEPGVSFQFTPEIRGWVVLAITEEQGHWEVFASFGIILLGLILRYARIRKALRVALLADGGVDLRGEAELLESLFEEELDAFAGELTTAGGPTAAPPQATGGAA